MNTKPKRISVEMIRAWLNRPVVEISFTPEMVLYLLIAMAAAVAVVALR